MSIIIQSTIMLMFITLVVIFMMKKLTNITKFNIMIYTVLTGFWVSSSFLKISMVHGGATWQWPAIMATYQFTQAAFRLPLGKFSQKIKSRKIPIISTVLAMVILSIPLMINVSLVTMFIAMIGLGIFGSSFGMQNQYWSENWCIKNTFITVGIISVIPHIGGYISSLVKEVVSVSEGNVKYMIAIMMIITIIVMFIYTLQKENKDSIMLDNKDDKWSIIKNFKLKQVLVMSIMISFISISINLINNTNIIHDNNNLLTSVTKSSLFVVTSMIVAFVLVRIISLRIINSISHAILIFGLSLMMIGNFGSCSYMISMIGFTISIIGASMYTISMMGTMLKFDHKNTLLVLGIWLSIKSASIATGTIITGEVSNFDITKTKYLIIVSLTMVFLSSITSFIIYKNFSKPVYETVYLMPFNKKIKQNFYDCN